MIFVTVGHELGFDRLIEAVDIWASQNPDHHVFAQVAELSDTSYRPKNFEYSEFLSPNEFESYFEKADVIVSHAGMGTIITALTKGKPIVVMPRRGHLKETRNDHQVATVKRFSIKKGLYPADDETRLSEALQVALAERKDLVVGKAAMFAETSLLETIRSFIEEK